MNSGRYITSYELQNELYTPNNQLFSEWHKKDGMDDFRNKVVRHHILYYHYWKDISCLNAFLASIGLGLVYYKWELSYSLSGAR